MTKLAKMGEIVSTVDQWAWWRAALAGTIGSVMEQQPESGFYRGKFGGRNGEPLRFSAIAFWRDKETGDLRCLSDGREVTGEHDMQALWLRCAKNPVTKPAYDLFRKEGRWPDEVVAEPQRSNLPSDPLENLKARIDGILERAREFLRKRSGEPDKTAADQARNLQVDVQRLAKEAEEMRIAEKRPHLEAERAIDARFKEIGEPLSKASKALEEVWKAFAAVEQSRLEFEARARYEAERRTAEAERARIEKERAALMRNDPIAAMTSPEPELPELPSGPDPVKVQVGGLTGPKASLRTKRELIITDWSKALAHYGERIEVRTLIEKLARADVKDGIALDFTRIEKVAA